jgi:hypothetical protein
LDFRLSQTFFILIHRVAASPLIASCRHPLINQLFDSLKNFILVGSVEDGRIFPEVYCWRQVFQINDPLCLCNAWQ